MSKTYAKTYTKAAHDFLTAWPSKTTGFVFHFYPFWWQLHAMAGFNCAFAYIGPFVFGVMW